MPATRVAAAKTEKTPPPAITKPAKAATVRAWGFVPGRDIKAVHLANGLFRELCGGLAADVSLLKTVVASRRGDNPKPAYQVQSNPDFSRAVELRAGLSQQATERAVDRLRATLDSVLNQDAAFYAAVKNDASTLTFTHRQHLTADKSDMQAGRLLAHVLLADPDQRAVHQLREALNQPTDLIYRLTAPLLKRLPPPAPLLLGLDDPVEEAVAKRLAASCVLSAWQQSFALLTRHASTLDKPALLQRAGTLAGMGLWLHLYNSGAAVCQPLLLCADRPLAMVREASRRTLALARRRLRATFTAALAMELEQSGEHEMTADQYRQWLPLQVKKKDAARCELEFDKEIMARRSPFEAAVRALTTPALKAAGSISAEECAGSLGRRLGLQWPRGKGGGERYLLPVAAVYDALVPALVKPDERIAAEEFWERAYTQFGFVCGVNLPDDFDRLAAVGVRGGLSPAHLQANARAVLEELRRLGYARTYADEVTLISPSW